MLTGATWVRHFMLKRNRPLPQENPGNLGWPLSRFLHPSSEAEKFSTYRAPQLLSIRGHNLGGGALVYPDEGRAPT